jgi:hypothetical protein
LFAGLPKLARILLQKCKKQLINFRLRTNNKRFRSLFK